MLPPGCQPRYFILVLGCRLNKVSPSSMSLGWSYTVDIVKSLLAFFTRCKTSFSPWYLQRNEKHWEKHSIVFGWICFLRLFILTQSLFCILDVGPRSPRLLGSQSDCLLTLHHPSSPASPLHDVQHPNRAKYIKKVSPMDHSTKRNPYSSPQLTPYLSKPLKAAYGWTLSWSVFETLP